MLSIAVLVSGNGTNLQAVIDYTKRPEVDAYVKTVVCDREGTYAVQRAQNEGIESWVFERKRYKKDLSDKILAKTRHCDLIVLAGFLSILSGEILKIFENRIINVHPSLIPSFCGPQMFGQKVHEAALKKGVKISGCTVHIVDEGTDTGRILVQKAVEVLEDDTPQSLAARILPYEHQALCEAIDMFVRGLL
ncbi:MAG TPA: phosphoribosylglycinamide formyltransferase [Thermotogota bacterium]|nr:phosphoribosylglycinamide formyltransferase [Thermotogota bacterium]